MYYAVIASDVPGSLTKRNAARAAHWSRLRALQDKGRLLLAGPHPAVDAEDPEAAGFTGSLIVAEFTCLEEARTWADNDPYRIAGVYDKVIVKPFHKVFPHGEAIPHKEKAGTDE